MTALAPHPVVRPALSRAPVFLAVCALVAIGATASAQDTPREALRRAVRMLAAGRYAEAIPELERLEREGAGPLAAYNLGLAYQAAGRRREAMLALSRYAAAPEVGAPAERLAAVRDEIVSLRAGLCELVMEHSPASARARVDELDDVWDTSIEIEPADGRRAMRRHAWLDPGHHVVIVEAPAHDRVTRDVELVAGSAAELIVSLAPVQRSAAPSPVVSPRSAVTVRARRAPRAIARRSDRTDGDPPVWTWVAAGSSGVAAAVALGLVIAGESLSGEWSDRCAGRVGDPSCESDRGEVQSTLDVYSGGIVAAVVVGVAGLVLTTLGLVTPHDDDDDARRSRRRARSTPRLTW